MFYFVWLNSRLSGPLAEPKELPADCKELHIFKWIEKYIGLGKRIQGYCKIMSILHIYDSSNPLTKVLLVLPQDSEECQNRWRLLILLPKLICPPLLGNNVLLIILAKCPSPNFGVLVSPVSRSSVEASSLRASGAYSWNTLCSFWKVLSILLLACCLCADPCWKYPWKMCYEHD